ncbi:MAG: hypothetical protein LBO76_05860 [Treponema sp.]|jgi:hypothetical protein|nr:hypothetical protein [Treponema sp.]
MNNRIALAILPALLAAPCWAQVPPETQAGLPDPGSGFFPLSLVLEAVQGGAGRWRPDWPREIPPDAFAVEGALDLGLDPGEGVLGRYRLARDAGGRLTDFPLALPSPQGPVFAQARISYGGEGGITGIDIELPAPEPAPGAPPGAEASDDAETSAGAEASDGAGIPDALLFSLRFEEPYFPDSAAPPRAGVVYGERRYYVLFSAGVREIAETWFDPQGVCTAYAKSRIAREAPRSGAAPAEAPWRITGLEIAEYGPEGAPESRPALFHYESGGNLSESSGGYGSFSAIYGAAGRPLAWSRDSLNFSLQWDQGGRLVRLRDLTGSPADFRYDYEFDSRGNWVRRRETALVRAGNLLLPAYSRDLVRRIVYAEEVGDGGLD